ncbi:MAG: TetR/AcrR family transcriptional regulator [Acidobacteria bacterium]|nr:MAG: TetR/AcrR family transcriptional regulator [Acidobacteriota bacterium]
MMALEKLDTRIRKEQIIEAALGLIASHGVRRLSMTAIARRVGLVPSALYRHFGSKQEILEAAVQLVGQRAGENLKAVRKLTPNSLDRMELLLAGIIKMIRDLHAMPRIIFSEGISTGHPEAKRQAYELLKGVLKGIEEIILEGQEQGEIRADLDAKSLSVVFWGMIPATVILWHLSDGQFDVTRHAEKSWELFREGIRAS